jgi:hypothetical protein
VAYQGGVKFAETTLCVSIIGYVADEHSVSRVRLPGLMAVSAYDSRARVWRPQQSGVSGVTAKEDDRSAKGLDVA